MIILKTQSDVELLGLVTSIKNFMTEWQIVNINIVEDTEMSRQEIMEQFLTKYKTYEGAIYPVSSTRIVMLIRMGIVENYVQMKSDIEEKIPGHACRVLPRKMSAIGLKKIQIDLRRRDGAIDLEDDLYSVRETRKENIVLVADDDSFIRRSMKTLLSSCGDVEEVETGRGVVPAYLKTNPDILFLDIHLPDKSGLDIIPDVLEVDPDAFIIVLSSDSMKENVIASLERGAAGFLTKPPSRQKVQEYLKQCITLR